MIEEMSEDEIYIIHHNFMDYPNGYYYGIGCESSLIEELHTLKEKGIFIFNEERGKMFFTELGKEIAALLEL